MGWASELRLESQRAEAAAGRVGGRRLHSAEQLVAAAATAAAAGLGLWHSVVKAS